MPGEGLSVSGKAPRIGEGVSLCKLYNYLEQSLYHLRRERASMMRVAVNRRKGLHST